jgi:ribosomal protein S15
MVLSTSLNDHCSRLTATACASPRNGNALTLPFHPFSTSTTHQASAVKPKFRDPYVVAQARARKAANLTRQQELGKQRVEELGDPVRGKPTPFVESFDVGRASETDNLGRLDHFVMPEELEQQLAASQALTWPMPVTQLPQGYLDAEKRAFDREAKEKNLDKETINERMKEMERDALDAINKEKIDKHTATHATVEEAMKRILNLDNANNHARLRVNIQRCIENFGRHETDKVLPPKAKAVAIPSTKAGLDAINAAGVEGAEYTDREARDSVNRKGPDTGSSEVQIAILTAKIRNLANFLDTRGRKDKVGKRDLRLLVHRRQKLLKYLMKKERGGPRWQRCVETLGLTDGTWRGEISL